MSGGGAGVFSLFFSPSPARTVEFSSRCVQVSFPSLVTACAVVCVCVCVCVCVRARAFVRTRARVCVCVCVRARACTRLAVVPNWILAT